MREEAPLRVAAGVDLVLALPAGGAAGDHRAVRRQDVAARDAQRLEELPPVAGLLREILLLEDGPARRERHEQPEEHRDEDEQLQDLPVHVATSPPCRGAPRRALSETTSRSASSTKFATIE